MCGWLSEHLNGLQFPSMASRWTGECSMLVMGLWDGGEQQG